MYIVVLLFFLSLVGLIGLIGNKVMLLQAGEVVYTEDLNPFTLSYQKIKTLVFLKTRKFGYKALIGTIKLYVKSINALREAYLKIKINVQHKLYNHNIISDATETPEVSKFLQMITDYKDKIKDIKEKVAEEERNK